MNHNTINFIINIPSKIGIKIYPRTLFYVILTSVILFIGWKFFEFPKSHLYILIIVAELFVRIRNVNGRLDLLQKDVDNWYATRGEKKPNEDE